MSKARHLTPAEFKVDLQELLDASVSIQAEASAIKANVARLATCFRLVENNFQSPAGQSCAELQKTFNRATENLSSLLEEMVRRMRHSYENYKRSEETNAQNLNTGHGAAGHPTAGGHHGAGHQHPGRSHHAGHQRPAVDGSTGADQPAGGTRETRRVAGTGGPDSARREVVTSRIGPA
ncbi:MAG: WXG100 family type VII secretion target [Catenulispora sp.]